MGEAEYGRGKDQRDGEQAVDAFPVVFQRRRDLVDHRPDDDNDRQTGHQANQHGGREVDFNQLLDAFERNVLVFVDHREDISLLDLAFKSEQQVRRRQVEEVQCMALQQLAEVSEFVDDRVASLTERISAALAEQKQLNL